MSERVSGIDLLSSKSQAGKERGGERVARSSSSPRTEYKGDALENFLDPEEVAWLNVLKASLPTGT
jgi:hypothetical protein